MATVDTRFESVADERGTLRARVLPSLFLGGRRSTLLIERNLLVYRHIWSVILSGFFEPVFYLLSIGVGIGELVGDIAGPGGRPIDYTAYVAPALLASSAMNGAVYESTMNIFFKLKFAKIYDAILATPSASATWPSARSCGASSVARCIRWVLRRDGLHGPRRGRGGRSS